MDITIKQMVSEEELVGKAYVHWKSWQETYPGIVDQRFLDALTLEVCEEITRRLPDDTIIAKDADKVIGFVNYGRCRDDDLGDAGEIYAIYVLSEYHGKGVGLQLMQAGLRELQAYAHVAVWVLKDNGRAMRFYEKCGFQPDGTEKTTEFVSPVTESRMILRCA